MKIIEEFIQGKRGEGKHCEDAIFKNKHFIAVIDGATSKGDFTYKGKGSAELSKDIIVKTLDKLDEKLTAHKAFEQITRAINDFYKFLGIEEQIQKKPEERFTSSAVIYSNYRKEIWQVGDCQGYIDEELFQNPKEIDEIFGKARAAFLHLMKIKGYHEEELIEKDLGWDFITPALKNQNVLQNNKLSEYSYGVLDGFDIPEEFIKIYDVSQANEIILASDGYPVLKRTLKESEDELSRIKLEDPLMIHKFKETKGLIKGNLSFDDRSYIRFNI